MRPEHLTEDELASFFRGELSASESRRVVRHLLTGCPSCRELSAGRWQTDVAARQREDGDRFDEIFERAARASLRLGSVIETERKAASELCSQLLRHPVERQKLLVINSSRYRSFGLTEALLDAAFQGGFHDPRQAIETAEVAVAMAERLAGSIYGERLVNDLRARAWGTLGNAQRISAQLLDAENSLERGFELAERGTGDPSERGRLLSFLASLRCEQLRFDEAQAIHREMAQIYRTLGDRHMQGRTTNQMAYVLRLQGEFARSIEYSRRAVTELDPERDRRTFLVTRQGLAASLLEVGRLGESEEECVAVRHAWVELGDELSALRCDWILGKIRHRQSRLDEAERMFRTVRDRFVELEMPIEAAQASLDLAENLFDQGRTAEMGRRLAEAIPLFRGLGIHREAIAALAFLRKATELEQVTVGLIRATARFVEESSRNPDLRFRAAALVTNG